MTDAIAIRGLTLPARVGVTDEERTQPQDVVVDITIRRDLERPAASDRLADTVDYAAVVAVVRDLLQATEVNLLEHLAHGIVTAVGRLAAPATIAVEVRKKVAPVVEDVREIAVRIERQL